MLMLLLVAGCAKLGEAPKPSTETPVILISIDTLRSDRLPAYGYQKVSTPHLDAFRQDSILFEHAYSHYPLTLPAHSSMFTGLLPPEHGVRDNLGYKLDESIPTLAEALRKAGYATGAAVSSYVLRQESGIARGFDVYDDDTDWIGKAQSLGLIQRSGDQTVEAANRWVSQQTKPFFLFLHLYEPHTPYEAPEPYKSRYGDEYDAEIAWVDELVGRFLQTLKSRDLYDRALIIILSDHGEGLGDHGEQEHGLFIYREAIQVPMLVKLPRSRHAAASVPTAVQLIDVMPTVLSLTVGDFDRAKLQGTSVIDFVGAPAPAPRRVYAETQYPRLHFGWSDLHSLIDGTHHYIHAPTPELYRVDRDPLEKQNVFQADRRTYFALRRAIEPHLEKAAAPAVIDPEEAAKLAALGYLGATVPLEPGEALPDPKEKLETFRSIMRAFARFREGKLLDALELIERNLRENERIVDLWSLKAKVLRRLGRLDEAVEASKGALKLSPQMPHLAIDVANLALEAERLDEAAAHTELFRESQPAKAHEILAKVWIGKGDLAKAEAEGRLALEKDREKVYPLMTLAEVKKKQDDLPAARKLLDEALQAKKEKQQVPNLHHMRGDVLARMGYGQDAEREFRREIALFPEEPQSYKNLMLLLVAQGRLEEGTRLIYELIEASPTPPSYIAISHALQVLGDARGSRYWAVKGLQIFPDHRQLKQLAAGTYRG
ncbi:MAG TPA: sulfatase-like hydrolase/transferase [Thermoanaerobaculia bacterium]|nr:sulfatase-like hydrolase/transferase [Thermoanaerobaculia bacterium]